MSAKKCEVPICQQKNVKYPYVSKKMWSTYMSANDHICYCIFGTYVLLLHKTEIKSIKKVQ
jgi:hypothetical protein